MSSLKGLNRLRFRILAKLHTKTTMHSDKTFISSFRPGPIATNSYIIILVRKFIKEKTAPHVVMSSPHPPVTQLICTFVFASDKKVLNFIMVPAEFNSLRDIASILLDFYPVFTRDYLYHV